MVRVRRDSMGVHTLLNRRVLFYYHVILIVVFVVVVVYVISFVDQVIVL